MTANRLPHDHRVLWLGKAMSATGADPAIWERNAFGELRRGSHDCFARRRMRVWVWLRTRLFSYQDIAEITMGRRGCYVTVMDAVTGRKNRERRALALARAGAVGKGTK